MTLSQWMQDHDVSFDELVERSKLDRKLVEAIVAGRYTPSPEQRRRVCDALGVEMQDIRWGHFSEVDHMYGHGPQFGRSP